MCISLCLLSSLVAISAREKKWRSRGRKKATRACDLKNKKREKKEEERLSFITRAHQVFPKFRNLKSKIGKREREKEEARNAPLVRRQREKNVQNRQKREAFLLHARRAAY